MKIYKKYENENMHECMNAYVNGDKSKKYYCDKFNICLRTFDNHWKKQKQNILSGGKIDKNKLPMTKEQKKVFKDAKQKQKQGIDFMENMKGGSKNANLSEFIKDNCNNTTKQEQKPSGLLSRNHDPTLIGKYTK